MAWDPSDGNWAPDSRRRVVVFASQCQEMPMLGFLPPPDYQRGQTVRKEWRLVFDLYEQLIHPRAGGCLPVEGLEGLEGLAPARPGLVINPTMRQAEKGLESAIDEAARDEALLLVYYVGHGAEYLNPDETPALRHFLQVIDTSGNPVDSGNDYRGFNPYRLIRERRKHVERTLAGLVLIVDACQASSAAKVVGDWFTPSAEFRTAWMGSSRQEAAYDGCFTRKFTELLREGVPRAYHPDGSLVTQLRPHDVAPLIEKACGSQRPVVGGYQYHDPGMYVASNRAADGVLADLGLGGRDGELILRLMSQYHPYQLREVADASKHHRLSVVIGEAGTGKSTLAAALRHPPPSALSVDESADAVGFVGLVLTVSELTETLHRQLTMIDPFRMAAKLYKKNNSHHWETLPSERQLLTGPLSLLSQSVTLVIDGLDRLDETQQGDFWGLITRLTTDESLEHVRVIATSRPGSALPDFAHRIPLGALDSGTARAYLTCHGIEAARHNALMALAGGSWLVLELAADHAARLPDKPAGGDGASGALYESMFESVKQRLDWQIQVQPVLAVLSAAVGDGPALPFRMFARTVEILGGPATRGGLYEVLADDDLYRLIDRPTGKRRRVSWPFPRDAQRMARTARARR